MARIKSKQHIREGGLTLAICDEDLLGKEFEEGKVYLNVSKSFYDGQETDAEELKHLIMGAKSANIVGKESITIAKEALPELEVKEIQGIPYAIMIRA